MSGKPVVKELGALTWGLYVGSLVLMGLAGWQVWGKTRKLSEWPEVVALVTASRVDGEEHGYRGEVDFAYAEGGMKWTSSGHDEVLSESPDEVRARLSQWPVGSKRTIRYNPSDPSDVDFTAAGSPTRFIWPAVLFLLGVGALVLAIVRTSEKIDEIKATQVAPEPPPDGGPLPDVDWVARAEEAADKRRVAAVAAKKVNVKLRRQVRRILVGGVALAALGVLLLGVAWLKARPELTQRDWNRTDATAVGVAVIEAQRPGKAAIYSTNVAVEIAQAATKLTLLAPGGGWHKARGPAEKDSARYEFGSAHTALVDPAEPYRARLAETLSWTDFGWAIVLVVVALASFGGGGMFFREALQVKASGGKKGKTGARGPSLTPKGTPRATPRVSPPGSQPPVE